MSNNREHNRKATDSYRKQLKAMLDDVMEIDVRVINKAVRQGVKVAKERTNVVSGFMRKSWKSTPTIKSSSGVTKTIFNNMDYASFVNYGHRIVSKNGSTVGFTKGQYMLEAAIKKTEQELAKEFKKEVERVNRAHGK